MPHHAGRVEQLHVSTATRAPMRAVERAIAVAGAGLEGCRHSTQGNDRAVLLVELETLRELGIEPGQIKENVTTSGIDLRGLAAGTRLQVGRSAVLEVTGPCAPCRRMDEIRAGLRAELQGRRGTICRVLAGGDLRLGDAVVIARAGRALS